MNSTPPRKRSRRQHLFLMNSVSGLFSLAVLSVLIVAGLEKLLPYSFIRSVLDQRAGDGSADLYTSVLHQRVVTALAASIVCTMTGSVVAIAYRTQIQGMLCVFLREWEILAGRLWTSIKESWPALALTALVATLSRWPFIHLPMRFDESYTYLQYAAQPLYVTISKYDAPNNHVLHSVLVWLCTRLGGNTPEVIRLPAFVCGVLTCVAVTWWGARRGGCLTGLLAGSLVAMSSPLVEYSVNARGYTLVHLLILLIWIMIDEWSQRPSRAALSLAAALASLALWTMPTAVYPLLILGVYAWERRTRVHERNDTQADLPSPATDNMTADLLRAAFITGTLTIILYLPLFVVSGFGAITSSGQGQFHSINSWWRGLIQSTGEAGRLVFRDHPGMALAMQALGAILSPTSRRMTCWTLLGLLACLAVLTIQQVVPPARTWLFLAPVFACLGVVGYSDLIRERNGNCRLPIWLGVMAFSCLWPGYNLLTRNSIRYSQETGVCRSAESIVHDLRPLLSDQCPIIATSPTSAPLAYYAMRASLPASHFFTPNRTQISRQRAIVVTSKSPQQTVSDVLAELQLTKTYSSHGTELRMQFLDADVFELVPLSFTSP